MAKGRDNRGREEERKKKPKKALLEATAQIRFEHHAVKWAALTTRLDALTAEDRDAGIKQLVKDNALTGLEAHGRAGHDAWGAASRGAGRYRDADADLAELARLREQQARARLKADQAGETRR
jgi:hypothetical protein